VQFDNASSGWSLALWDRHITDELVTSYQQQANDTPTTGIFKSSTYQPPRTFGVTVAKDF